MRGSIALVVNGRALLFTRNHTRLWPLVLGFCSLKLHQESAKRKLRPHNSFRIFGRDMLHSDNAKRKLRPHNSFRICLSGISYAGFLCGDEAKNDLSFIFPYHSRQLQSCHHFV